MKYRIGFVSNSSSSSFCIMGSFIKDININKQLIYNLAKDNEFIKRNIEFRQINNSSYNLNDYLNDILDDEDNEEDVAYLLKCIFGDDYEYDGCKDAGIESIFGIDIYNLFKCPYNGDGNKMKQTVVDAIRKIDSTFDESNVIIYHNGYYDG